MASNTTFRSELLDALNPPETPDEVDIVTKGEEQTEDFTRTLLEFTVADGHRNEAYLLVPHAAETSEEKLPGILAIHQHGGRFYVGKSEPVGLSARSDFFYAKELCERGYVVLVPDLLCFESRRPPEFRREEGTSPAGFDYEKFEAMRYLLDGSTLQGKYLADLSVALDVLAGLDNVDAGRLGAIGHSLGGQESIWLSWYDDRLSAAVSSCGMSRYEAIVRDELTHNFAAYVPGLTALGDIEDILASIAPQPMMLTSGAKDRIFPIDAVRAVYDQLGETYASMGHADRFNGVVFDDAHAYPPAMREQSYEWLDEHLT